MDFSRGLKVSQHKTLATMCFVRFIYIIGNWKSPLRYLTTSGYKLNVK
jgi:hypothetical protein